MSSEPSREIISIFIWRQKRRVRMLNYVLRSKGQWISGPRLESTFTWHPSSLVWARRILTIKLPQASCVPVGVEYNLELLDYVSIVLCVILNYYCVPKFSKTLLVIKVHYPRTQKFYLLYQRDNGFSEALPFTPE